MSALENQKEKGKKGKGRPSSTTGGGGGKMNSLGGSTG